MHPELLQPWLVELPPRTALSVPLLDKVIERLVFAVMLSEFETPVSDEEPKSIVIGVNTVL